MKPSAATRRQAIELCSIAACEGTSLARAGAFVYGKEPEGLRAIPGDVWQLAQQARFHMYWAYREELPMAEVLYQDTVLEAEYLLRDGWCP